MAKKKIVKKEEAGLPANLEQEMEDDAGDGRQGITTKDLAIPFLRILQKMSPQLSKRDGAYIEDAEEGDIFNTVTGEIWSGNKGVLVVPAAFHFKYIEWKPREDGGGFVASFTRDEELPSTEQDERGRAITGAGNLLSDTAEHYVAIVGANGHVDTAVIAMSSTQLKHSRKWNSMISQQQIQTKEGMKPAPTYSRLYRLKTTSESNEQGDWVGWSITLEGVVDNIDLYRSAKSFSQAVNQGQIAAKHTTLDGAEAESVM